nr:hypothetical protein [Tanacetum cinerariifolium]
MIQVKEMMQDKDLKNSESKDKGSRSRSRSMNEKSHYKQEKTEARPKKAKLKRHIFNIREDKITANVPEIYMQEFWATISIHHTLIHFKMNGKSHTLNIENFKDMLQICPRLPDSEAYQEYYIVSSGAEPPKSKTKYKKKADKPVTPSKSKSSPTTKGKRLKTPAKVTQSRLQPKAKRLAVLSNVALTKAEQIKLAIKTSKKDLYMSYATGSGDRVDIQSKVPDEQQQKTFSQDEDDADEEIDVNDDSEEIESDNDGDDLTHPNLSTYKADDEKEEEEEKADDDEVSSDYRVYTPPDHQLTDEEENQEGDDKVKECEDEHQKEEELYANQVTEDIHVILTTVPLKVQQQSSSVSSYLVSKFINPSLDTGINSILSPNIQSETLVNVPVSIAAETPSSDTTIPQPPIPNIKPLQQTPKSITTTTIPTKTLPYIPNFASLFQFDQRVSALETELSDFIQTNQFAEAISSITSTIDNYLASKMKEAMDVVDSTIKTIIKEQVQAQVSKIMPKINKSQPKSSSKSAQADEHGQKVDDLEDQSHQEFNTGNNDETSVREALDVDESTCKSVVELEYHLEEVFKATNDRLDWHNPEGKPYPHDLSKSLPLI